jgi:hypothetical protein
LNMSSHTLDSTRASIGLSPPLSSIRDRRDGRRGNGSRKRSKPSAHVLVKLPTESTDNDHPLLEPDMIEPFLRSVEQALGEGSRKAKEAHRHDPRKVKEILLSGPTADRI